MTTNQYRTLISMAKDINSLAEKIMLKREEKSLFDTETLKNHAASKDVTDIRDDLEYERECADEKRAKKEYFEDHIEPMFKVGQ